MEEEKKGFKKEELIKLLAIVGVLLGLLIYSIFTGRDSFKSKDKDTVVLDVNKLFEPIKDNYELIIDKTINEDEEHVEFINDGTFKLYNVNNDNKGYLIYNGKTYIVELKGRTIKDYNKKEEFFDDNYANIDFIKKLVNHCEITNKKRYEFDCVIKISDYINEYNGYFYSNHKYDGEEEIVFKIKHGSIVSDIIVDYTKVNSIIKNNDKYRLRYNIKINKVNSNDYSELFEIFKDKLKK